MCRRFVFDRWSSHSAAAGAVCHTSGSQAIGPAAVSIAPVTTTSNPSLRHAPGRRLRAAAGFFSTGVHIDT